MKNQARVSYGDPRWPDSSCEAFWSEIKTKNKSIEKNIKKIVDILEKHVNTEARLWYEVSPSTKCQNVIVCFPMLDRTVLCLDSSGKLRLYCKGKTIWHRIHRNLLERLRWQEPFGQKQGKNKVKDWIYINIAQEEDKDIDTLCQLYLKAITDEMGIQNK